MVEKTLCIIKPNVKENDRKEINTIIKFAPIKYLPIREMNFKSDLRKDNSFTSLLNSKPSTDISNPI